MKLKASILLLFMCLIAQAQEVESDKFEPVKVNKVKNMAIYPGCEELKRNNRDLITCFAEKLNEDFLKNFDTNFPKETTIVRGKMVDRIIDREFLYVLLGFHVNTEGEITNVTAKKGNSIIFSRATSALERTAKDLKRQGKKIIPAKMADGSDVTVKMNLPIRLRNPNYRYN